MRTTGVLLLVLALGASVWMAWSAVKMSYEWDNQFGSSWTLAIKASTISQKSEYIDKFVEALEKSGLQGEHNALLYFTPDNSFDENFKALKSLQGRLQEIKTIDPNSFQYQTAIQQITAQEQDEATDMISVLHGTWAKVHWYYLWNPFIAIGAIIVLFALGGVVLAY